MADARVECDRPIILSDGKKMFCSLGDCGGFVFDEPLVTEIGIEMEAPDLVYCGDTKVFGLAPAPRFTFTVTPRGKMTHYPDGVQQSFLHGLLDSMSVRQLMSVVEKKLRERDQT